MEEARTAFRHNVHVYREEERLVVDGAIGMVRMVGGFTRVKLGLA